MEPIPAGPHGAVIPAGDHHGSLRRFLRRNAWTLASLAVAFVVALPLLVIFSG